jgi:hypothetical protein
VYQTCDTPMFALSVFASVIIFAFAIPYLCRDLDECKDPPTWEEVLISTLCEIANRPRTIKIVPQAVPGWKCDYCGGLGVGDRCKSCGAPRQ